MSASYDVGLCFYFVAKVQKMFLSSPILQEKKEEWGDFQSLRDITVDVELNYGRKGDAKSQKNDREWYKVVKSFRILRIFS